MRSKSIIEIIISLLFVFVGTYFTYGYLKSISYFWSAQTIWSIVLIIGWIIVSLGYYHQGMLIHKKHNAENVSLLLSIAVFFIQCVLFIKGIYYKDWSLIFGALIVNCGVSFSLYHIIKYKKF